MPENVIQQVAAIAADVHQPNDLTFGFIDSNNTKTNIMGLNDYLIGVDGEEIETQYLEKKTTIAF